MTLVFKSTCKSALYVVFALAFVWSGSYAQTNLRFLVFSKTAGFRHESINAGKDAFVKMAKEKNLSIDFSEDASLFTNNSLKKYHAIIFLNTTGNILNDEQQDAFERYIQAGGGYVGIHAATDTEYDWPWYGRIAGAYFLDHPMNPSNVQNGKFKVAMKNHWATEGMPDEFERKDEFYSFRNISKKINVLLTIDEGSYIGGKNPDYHPMSWFQEFEGGRSFYTAMGHTNESFSEPLFLNHLWAGMKYAAGGDSPKPLDYSKSKPEENRFTKVVLKDKLDEPMELTILPNGKVLFIQRKGELKVYNPVTKKVKTIAKIPVSTKYKNKAGVEATAEDGLLGLNKDPNFAINNWIYMYYSDPSESKNILTRYTLKGDSLILSSKKVLLEVPTQRYECCHTAGSIAWDKNGNLYLSTGDNTNPHASNGFSPSDERADRDPWDAQKSSANTNDLRGKIIRIKPNSDGTYTIPEGNLFPKGTPGTRPEIYTMGHRNPFRISIDPKTGFLYWGEVGPDAAKADSTRGPEGNDEVGQARKAGNFGWPHFVGNNKSYTKYDFDKKVAMEKWDAAAPTNNSPHNTGLKILPPAQSAFIWYPYGPSAEFPLVGNGGRNAMAGPVYYADQFKNAPRAFPNYYNGKLIIYEWMRGWMAAVTMDAEGNYVSMEKIMPSHKFSNPMDMEFSPNGDLYMLEYGTGWFSANDDARLIKIEYNKGNRKPHIEIINEKPAGAAPVLAKLSAKGTKDADGDNIKYSWTVTSKNGFIKTFTTPDIEVNLAKIGTYHFTLVANDGNGGISTQSSKVVVGNEPPVLNFELVNSNKSFYYANNPFEYRVLVEDKEDGSLDDGKIAKSEVAVNIDYMAEGFDKISIAQGHRSADEDTRFAKGKRLIADSDCKACHAVNKISAGPSYNQISLKYRTDTNVKDKLVNKVITGGAGVWGKVAMPPHTQLSKNDAREMVDYILNLTAPKIAPNNLPVAGTYTPMLPKDDKGVGVFILRSAYKDRGANGVAMQSSEKTYILRNPKINMHEYDVYADINKVSFGGNNLAIASKPGSYMGVKNIDLTGIKSIHFVASAPKAQVNAAGGQIEVRLGSPTGKKIGTSDYIHQAASFGQTQIDAIIEKTEGFHDIYLVFINPDPNAQTLFILFSAEYTNKLPDIKIDESTGKSTSSANGNAPTNTGNAANELSTIISKYIDALGGKSVLNNMNTMIAETNTSVMGNDAPGKIFISQTKGYKNEMDMMGSKIIQAVNGTGGWTINPMAGSGATDITYDQYTVSKGNMFFGGIFSLYPSAEIDISLAGKELLNGNEVYKLMAGWKNGSQVVYYIDTKNYHLIKTESPGEMMGQKITIKTNYSNYEKLENGYLIAKKIELDLGQFQLTSVLKNIQINPAIDIQIYNKP